MTKLIRTPRSRSKHNFEHLISVNTAKTKFPPGIQLTPNANIQRIYRYLKQSIHAYIDMCYLLILEGTCRGFLRLLWFVIVCLFVYANLLFYSTFQSMLFKTIHFHEYLNKQSLHNFSAKKLSTSYPLFSYDSTIL